MKRHFPTILKFGLAILIFALAVARIFVGYVPAARMGHKPITAAKQSCILLGDDCVHASPQSGVFHYGYRFAVEKLETKLTEGFALLTRKCVGNVSRLQSVSSD